MGSVIFIDTSAFIAILTLESDRAGLIDSVQAAKRRLTSPLVRVETAIALATRLRGTPREAEVQFERFREEAEIDEIDITSAIGAAAVACFETYGKGRHPARLNFADCLSYACAKAHSATLLFKGDDFAKTDVNATR